MTPGTDDLHPQSNKRVTLQDVASAAGVSVTSASRSLHGVSKGARRPSLATVERVRAVADGLGYTRDQMASGLRTRQSRLLGMLVPKLSDHVLATIYEGVEEAAGAAGYRTVVANSHDDPAEQRARTKLMLDHRVDGLIFGDAHVDGEFIDEVRQRGTPYILVSRRAGDHPAVTCDDVQGGRIAAQHLIDLGHTEFAVLAGKPYASTGIDRCQGFVERLKQSGLTVPAERIIFDSFDARGGHRAMHRVLNDGLAAPTAVFAVNDFSAIGAMGALRDAGLVVGEQVAVIGFNDVSLAAELPIPLSTVASPMEEMGKQAVGELLRVMAGEPARSIRLPPHLKIRASTSRSA